MFHKNLKQAMMIAQMNQSELSALTGIGKPSISQYLSGKNVPNDRNKQKLADVLEVSIAFLDGKTDCSDAITEPAGLKNVSVEQCAKRLGKSKQFIRVAIQRGIVTFGFAVKVTGDKWSYHISPKKLDEYIGGLTA